MDRSDLVEVVFFIMKFNKLTNQQKDTKEVVLEAVKNYGEVLQFASNRLKDDKDVVLEAVKNIPISLIDASKRLKDDKEVVLEAVKQNGLALEYVSDRLKNDKELLEILEKEILEKEGVKHWYSEDEKKWYQDRMEFLNNLRNKEEKDLMENSMILSDIKPKTIKF